MLGWTLFLASCGPGGDGKGKDKDVVVEDTTPTVPEADLSGVDASLYEESLALLLGVSADTVWSSIDVGLAAGEPGCPDLYMGNPDPNEIDFDGIDDEFDGWSWYDDCTTSSGVMVGGVMLWETALSVTMDKTDTMYGGSRGLVGNSYMGTGDSTRVAFQGSMFDSLSLRVSPSGAQTVESYDLDLDGMVGGTDIFGGDGFAPNGWRSTLTLAYEPGEFEVVGSVYLYGTTIDQRFDSWVYDLSTANEDCPSEPNGWMAVRSNDGFWFELDYETPLDYADTDTGDTAVVVPKDDPYALCDGCGVLYVRGIDQLERTEIGVLCPDFTDAWALFVAPDPEGFVYTMH